jgi:hypothetical protein
MMYSVSHAQPTISLAFKAGPNAARQAEDLRVNRYGFSGGLLGEAQWPLVDRISLAGQLELLSTPRGAEVVSEGTTIGKIRNHYLDLAIAARPEVSFGTMSAYLLVGGGLDYLMSATKDDATGSGQDITDGVHRLDVAVLGAIGVALHLPRHDLGPLHLATVFLEARHDIGLLDVDLGGGFKNRTSSLMLGLSFVVGGAPAAGASATTQLADRLRAR